MIVTATLDLSESGRTPLPEDPTEVLIFASDDNFALAEACAAIASTRLIREGHVFSTTIDHSVGASLGDHIAWVVDPATGEVTPRS